MRALLGVPVRWLLLALMLVALLPAAGIAAWNAAEARRRAVEGLRTEAKRVADDLAATWHREEHDARRLVTTLANLPAVQGADVAACDKLFSSLLTHNPRWNSLQLSDAAGLVVSSARPMPGRIEVRDRKYWQDALRTGGYAVGEYIVGRTAREPMLNFASAVGPPGAVTGVVQVGITMAQLAEPLAGVDLPEGTEVMVTDHAGTVLFVRPTGAAQVGARDPEALDPQLDQDAGAYRDLRRVGAQLVTYRRLHTAPGTPPYLTVRVAMPEAAALARAREVLLGNLAVLLGAVLLAVGGASLIGRISVETPLIRLVAAARRIATGDLAARAGAVGGSGELAQLTTAFDEMAGALQAREAARAAAQDQHDRLEEQLRHAQRLEAIGRLAGGVAHDFNNLLTAIRGSAGFLLEETPPGAPGRVDLEEIDRAAERAAALTRQLLAFSRKQPLAPAVIDPNRVVREAHRLLARLVGERVRLELRLAEPVGAVRADPGQLEQVLANLVVNARDALPGAGAVVISTGEETLDEAAAARRPGALAGRWVVLTVTDDGAGMTDEVKAHLFEPFFTTKGPGVGTGLGLATVYGIASQSGGFVEVDSELGRGTSIRVYLPRCPERPEVAGEAREASLTTAARGARILVVEDEPAVREVARRALSRLGYEVAEAASAEAALALVEGGAPCSLVLSDVVLPGLSGWDLVARLRADRPGLRVLLMSGYDPASHGADHAPAPVLAKPFTAEQLGRAVQAALEAAPQA